MAELSLTLSLPDGVYENIKQRAAQMNRSIEAEIAAVVSQSVPSEEQLPPELARAVADLAF